MAEDKRRLTEEQKALFDRLAADLKTTDTTVWLPAIDALREHAEVTIECERPYRGARPSFLPLSG